ncbi:MAG: 23S rRNA (adenine(2030)-N(6))-methyltransferase RlmJ, partial [Alphaproteobacteria bacterium]|nr:23S rRNA (adenine(2030)-N(6))-methyltransferase RlmJ [Alphaproteobacteria bacterium]
MNYRHIFHAGNFSDVLKHFVLTLCLEKLVQKSTPFCVIDTHAGIGQYNLASTLAQKTKEFERGIERVLKAPHLPASFDSYIKVVTAY